MTQGFILQILPKLPFARWREIQGSKAHLGIDWRHRSSAPFCTNVWICNVEYSKLTPNIYDIPSKVTEMNAAHLCQLQPIKACAKCQRSEEPFQTLEFLVRDWPHYEEILGSAHNIYHAGAAIKNSCSIYSINWHVLYIDVMNLDEPLNSRRLLQKADQLKRGNCVTMPTVVIETCPLTT